jgi:transcription elongation factor GreA
MIVGSAEADPRAGKISHISPIGRALLNHQPGEKVLVQLPEGHAEYEICTVS